MNYPLGISKEPKSCAAHRLPLQTGLAQISYGLLEIDERYLADKRDLFPNSNSWVAGAKRLGVARITLLRAREAGRILFFSHRNPRPL